MQKLEPRYNLTRWKSNQKGGKHLKELTWFQGNFIERLKQQVAQCNVQRVLPGIPDFSTYIVQSRNYMKYKLWRACRNLEDRWAEHPGMTEEEQAKVDEALTILAEVIDRNNWNENTYHLKNTQKL